jgi:hypothetical protein
MIRLELTKTNGIFTQSISELCEHCEEKVRDLHISDITSQKPFDTRRLKIRNKAGALVDVKSKADRKREIQEQAISESLLDDYNEELKYGMRAEGFCSQSVDPDSATTSSFCYRVDHPKVIAKFGNLFSNATSTNVSGSKKGIRRIKPTEDATTVHLIQRVKAETNADGDVEREYPWNVSWVRELEDVQVDEILTKESDCEAIEGQAGRYRSYAEWRANWARSCG